MKTKNTRGRKGRVAAAARMEKTRRSNEPKSSSIPFQARQLRRCARGVAMVEKDELQGLWTGKDPLSRGIQHIKEERLVCKERRTYGTILQCLGYGATWCACSKG